MIYHLPASTITLGNIQKNILNFSIKKNGKKNYQLHDKKINASYDGRSISYIFAFSQLNPQT